MTTLDEVVRTHRGELVGLAYRMLGSVTEAEDVAQEALLRLQRHGLDDVERPGAWLARAASRLCLDRLRSAERRRESYIGPWLPEPLVDTDDPAGLELAESLSLAFLVVLESLSPAQRIAFVLHDVFGHEYDELASMLDRSEQACRQLVSRARASVRARRPHTETTSAELDELVEAFLAAAAGADLDAVLRLLAPEVTFVADGGGVLPAVGRPLVGADRVAAAIVALARTAGTSYELRRATVNGRPGAVVTDVEGNLTVVDLDVADSRVVAIHAIRNPAKLTHVPR